MVANGSHNNARKTHCKNGHAFTPENTYVEIMANGRTRRDCVTCAKDRARRSRERAS
jgi:hypothetical protein